MAGNFNSGRKALPDSIKALTGTLRPGAAQAMPVQGKKITSINTCMRFPAYSQLSDEGKSIYRRVCKIMMALQLLEEPYLVEVVHYARWESVYWEASRKLEKEGMFTFAANGSMVQHPALRVMDMAEHHIAHFGSNFGLSPVERQKIRASITKDDKPSGLKAIKLEAIYGDDEDNVPDDQ